MVDVLLCQEININEANQAALDGSCPYCRILCAINSLPIAQALPLAVHAGVGAYRIYVWWLKSQDCGMWAAKPCWPQSCAVSHRLQKFGQMSVGVAGMWCQGCNTPGLWRLAEILLFWRWPCRLWCRPPHTPPPWSSLCSKLWGCLRNLYLYHSFRSRSLSPFCAFLLLLVDSFEIWA